MMKNKITFFLLFVLSFQAALFAENLTFKINLLTPGNLPAEYPLQEQGEYLVAKGSLPVEITQQRIKQDSVIHLTIRIKAKERAYFHFESQYNTVQPHTECQFYMPGFWYRRNLRSPKEAPSFATSDSWQVREDRLSTPLTGIYNEKSGDYFEVLRRDDFKEESLACHTAGDVILTGNTSLGYTGFRNVGGNSTLVFGYPYAEAPKTYLRKLMLAPSVRAFVKLEPGEIRELNWVIRRGKAPSFSAFVADTWNYSYDTFKPQPVKEALSPEEAKAVLTNFFTESYVDTYELKYFSGIHMRTDDCKSNGGAEVGFIGRVLLNAFNALEYGESHNRPDLVQKANAIYESYLEYGFTPAGYFREFVDFKKPDETSVYSIRRQSEGVFAVLNYLSYEKRQGRKHPEWEARLKKILDNFLSLQEADGSFPRKFKEDGQISDASGGSTPSATLPLAMAFHYFKEKKYLESARKTAVYLETELVSKSDYFSSTLDANCEDKEASLYASTAFHYLAMVTKNKAERKHYIDLCKESAYFALSWYYVWDVPFAPGQMLGDVGFQSRGWGNVSVENNHIDVFIFEFATVLDWLANECNEPRFSTFSSVIKSSMLQLMPVEGHMFNIAKVGYYPEVVQHTNWDYGKNGKGFYNDIFAPGWTVASLWQMLSPERVETFFKTK